MRAHNHLSGRARAAALLTAAVAVLAAGCDGLLSVDDPGAILEEDLADPALEQLIVNGAVGEFQVAFSRYALWSGVISDEIFTDHTNIDVREFSLRTFLDHNSVNEDIYENLQRARASADDGVERLQEILGDRASTSLNVARLLAYGGYTYALLGEGFCEAPVDMSAPFSADELLSTAVERFDESVTVANAAESAGADAGAAEELIHLARLGAARATLQAGTFDQAIAYASQVPEGFEQWIYHSTNSTRENNPLYRPARSGDPYAGVAPRFLDLDDPRVPHTADPELGLNANEIHPPHAPSMYDGWSAADPTRAIAIDADVRFASGLEARYILAEAEGPTAETRDFVDERRALAGQGPTSAAGDELMSELRDQRARDFFLSGQRLGDLRRYQELYGLDLFPTGQYPVFPDHYGNVTCFLVPQSEKASNPNY